MKIITTTLLAAALLHHASAPAQSQSGDTLGRPVLRTNITVSGELVRVGDFVAQPGRAAEAAVFRAPDLGETGNVPVSQVIEALRTHGILGVDTRGASAVTVHRASRVVSAKEIEALVAAAIAAHANVSDPKALVVNFDRAPRAVHLEPAVQGELQVVQTRYSSSSQRFEVAFDVSAEASVQQAKFRYTGTAFESTPVAVLTRPMARGDVIRASDIAIERKPRAQVGGDSVGAMQEIAGLAARRPLRAGQPLRANDLMKPEVVRQNETVTITYDMPGLALTVRGKALETGSEGDVINVLNAQSKRTLQATVAGPGRVTVVSMTARANVERPIEVTSALPAHHVQQRTE
jgi:flagella basal body P-ring formation protein FlgA